MLSGLAKLAYKGWAFQIHCAGGTPICAKNLKHSHPMVQSKALELLHFLSAEPATQAELVNSGVLEIAVSHAFDASKTFEYASDCWRHSLGALANFACSEDEAVHTALVEAGGAPALVNNLGTEMQPQCARGLAALTGTFGYHPLLIQTPLLVRTLTLVQDPAAPPRALADGAAILANLADNESCHVELQRAGAMQVLVAVKYGNNERLRREVGRALTNMCRVVENQRAILNYMSVWDLFAALAFATTIDVDGDGQADLLSSGIDRDYDGIPDALQELPLDDRVQLDEAVAADFYLFISENEGMPEVLRFCDIPSGSHLAEPVTRLGEHGDLTTKQKAAVAIANFAASTPSVLVSDGLLELLTRWLDSTDETLQSEAVRAIGSLCDGDEQFSSLVLQKVLVYGALKPLGALVTLDEVVLKCAAIKIVAHMFNSPECHSAVLQQDGLSKMLALALSRDFVVKAEAVNSLGNLYANPGCHAQLVKLGGLGVALSMATSDDALVAQKGLRMLDTISTSQPAHVPLVRVGVLKRYRELAPDCSEGLQASIAAGFMSITTDPDALLVMCQKESVEHLFQLAMDDTHPLSSEALNVLMKISERFADTGKSALAVGAVADLSSQPSCRSQVIDEDGYGRLAALVQSKDTVVRREATRALSNLMDNANDA